VMYAYFIFIYLFRSEQENSHTFQCTRQAGTAGLKATVFSMSFYNEKTDEGTLTIKK